MVKKRLRKRKRAKILWFDFNVYRLEYILGDFQTGQKT